MRWIREPQALGSNSLRNLLCLKRWCFGTEEQGGEDRASKKGKKNRLQSNSGCRNQAASTCHGAVKSRAIFLCILIVGHVKFFETWFSGHFPLRRRLAAG